MLAWRALSQPTGGLVSFSASGPTAFSNILRDPKIEFKLLILLSFSCGQYQKSFRTVPRTSRKGFPARNVARSPARQGAPFCNLRSGTGKVSANCQLPTGTTLELSATSSERALGSGRCSRVALSIGSMEERLNFLHVDIAIAIVVDRRGYPSNQILNLVLRQRAIAVGLA